jgi:hypothetical protein
MSEDDRIDEIIRSLSDDYNRPPAVPREEMWTAIQNARQAPGPRLHVTAGGASTRVSAIRRYTPWIGMAAAAGLLVATGIGIGRWTNRAESLRNVAEAPAAVPAPPNDEIGSAPTTAEPAPAESSPGENPLGRSPEEIRRNPLITSIRKPSPISGRELASTLARPADPGIYQVATTRHLADAEALLTTFSLETRDAAMNRNFAEWAKGLLSNTRLLLDSPAGDDPRRAKLLQDLELVLAQIVQLSPGTASTDRELIKGSIQEANVITRLRTAIPANSAGEILER